MKPARISPSMRAISLLITVSLAGFPAQARHGGGTETPEDPVYFADSILKARVEAQLGVTNPTAADMEFLKELIAPGRGISDLAGLAAVVIHPDSDAVLTVEWQEWSIPLADLIAAGVDVTAIRKLNIGVGELDNPQPGGIGIIYVDDIRITNHIP